MSTSLPLFFIFIYKDQAHAMFKYLFSVDSMIPPGLLYISSEYKHVAKARLGMACIECN